MTATYLAYRNRIQNAKATCPKKTSRYELRRKFLARELKKRKIHKKNLGIAVAKNGDFWLPGNARKGVLPSMLGSSTLARNNLASRSSLLESPLGDEQKFKIQAYIRLPVLITNLLSESIVTRNVAVELVE